MFYPKALQTHLKVNLTVGMNSLKKFQMSLGKFNWINSYLRKSPGIKMTEWISNSQGNAPVPFSFKNFCNITVVMYICVLWIFDIIPTCAFIKRLLIKRIQSAWRNEKIEKKKQKKMTEEKRQDPKERGKPNN